jgi:hypothetical protein
MTDKRGFSMLGKPMDDEQHERKIPTERNYKKERKKTYTS